MKSSTGLHFIALDHVRALAIFMVIVWHFSHSGTGFPIPFEGAPLVFPFAVLDEGHTGVALFMTLSGYLFSKLLDGKQIRFGAFLWNRALRLLPLLTLVVIFSGLTGLVAGEWVPYLKSIAKGVVLPSLPQGGWSITVEFHFYLMLPFLLRILRRSRGASIALVLVLIGLRTAVYLALGEVQDVAYLTIVGHSDQFLMGMLAFQCRHLLTGKHLLVLTIFLLFCLFFLWFDLRGGYYHLPSYPSTHPVWIVLPTIEALFYSMAIGWYDNSFVHGQSRLSRFIARIGEYSYSIYLLHGFVVFAAARLIHQWVGISNFYQATFWSLVFLVAMMPLAAVSHRFVEAPFLKFRKPYLTAEQPQAQAGSFQAPGPEAPRASY